MNDFGKGAPAEVRLRGVRQVIYPIFEIIVKRYTRKFDDLVTEITENSEKRKQFSPGDFVSVAAEMLRATIEDYRTVISQEEDCRFFGARFGKLTITTKAIQEGIETYFQHATEDNKRLMTELMELVLRKKVFSRSATGVVIAGFGSEEMFPTLISFEIDGIINGQLRYAETNTVDIDRSGPRARVIPFAQKEMVERFLHGLDEDISESIASFAQGTVSKVRAEILDKLKFSSDEDKHFIEESAEGAENAFINGLRRDAFDEIRSRSQAEIEDMVEFMPKPDFAKMAEALVNLTSIKRRVSRGMETVGGPIDVALISHSEGFVWVKRKWYFPSELNPRYYYRIKRAFNQGQEVNHDEDAAPGGPRRRRGKQKKTNVVAAEHDTRVAEGGDENE